MVGRASNRTTAFLGAILAWIAFYPCFAPPEPAPAEEDTLAAAYAEAGRFEEAVKTQQEALAPLKKGHSLWDEYRLHLKSYKDRTPWRDDGSKW